MTNYEQTTEPHIAKLNTTHQVNKNTRTNKVGTSNNHLIFTLEYKVV